MSTDNDSNYDNPEDFFWQTYLDASKDEDEARPKNWEGSTTGILTFTGLFAATVAAFIVESYKLLSPDPSDRTNVLLEQLFAAMANASSRNPIIAPPPESFSTPTSALITNVFWFSSLIIALVCALLSTLVQEWSRNYVQDINRRKILHESLRERAYNHIYIRMGVNRYGMDQFVSWIVSLVHLSVVLFACGLLTFLFPISHIVAVVTTGILGGFLSIYVVASLLPLVDKSCPYRTPVTYVMAFALWSILLILLRGLLRCAVEDESPADEYLNDGFQRSIMRQYTGDEDEFLTHPRFLFAWDCTYLHINDDNRGMFFKGLPSLIRLHGSHKSALNRMCADEDLMYKLTEFLYDSHQVIHREPTSSSIDSEIFELVALLSERMYALEVEHYGEHLEGSALTSEWLLDVIGYVSQIAEDVGPFQLSARLCLARIRLSLVELRWKAFEKRIPALREEEVSRFFTEASKNNFRLGNHNPNAILLLLTYGSYQGHYRGWKLRGTSTLCPLHDDDCCRDWRNALSPEGLAHETACNVLTAIAHIQESTDSQRTHSHSSLNRLFGLFGVFVDRDSAFQSSRYDGKQKNPSSDFVSVIRSAGLDEWLEPGSDFYTKPRDGPNHKFLCSYLGQRCVRILRGLAQRVDFEAYFDRARMRNDEALAETSILPYNVADASTIAHVIPSQSSSSNAMEDGPEGLRDARSAFPPEARQPLDHELGDDMNTSLQDFEGLGEDFAVTMNIDTGAAEGYSDGTPAGLDVERREVGQRKYGDAFDLRTVTIGQRSAKDADMHQSDSDEGERTVRVAGGTDLAKNDMNSRDPGDNDDREQVW